MRLTRRGVGWDRAQRARAYSTAGRVMALLGVAGILINIDPYLSLPTPLNVLMPVALLVGVASMFVGLLVSTEAPHEMLGDAEVDATGALHLRAGKQSRTFARAEMKGAWVVRRLRGRRVDHWVEVATRSGTTASVHVLNVDEGRALVEALGFGAAGRAVHMPLAKRSRRRFHLLLALLSYVAGSLLSGSQFLWGLLVLPALYALMRFAFRPPVLEIGHDALHVREALRTIRIPRADIARVYFFEPASLVIERKDGSKVTVSTLGLEPARVAAAADLIDSRMGDRPAPVRAAAFERGGRGLSEWRASLHTALEPTYRSSGTSVDDASDVLASSTASVEQRIGAALALRVAGEPLEKVRVAAEGTVDPKIRVVLEAIAEGADDEELDASLRAMER